MSLAHRSRMSVFALCVAVSASTAAAPSAAQSDEPRHNPVVTSERTPPASAFPSKSERAVQHALDVVGTPYRWGGESPSVGFDCSGLVRWAYSRVGVDLPHSSYALSSTGRKVPSAALKPGDVLLFEGLGHVGLYVGRGRMVHAPQTGRSVEVVRLGATNYGARLVGARRVAAS